MISALSLNCAIVPKGKEFRIAKTNMLHKTDEYSINLLLNRTAMILSLYINKKKKHGIAKSEFIFTRLWKKNVESFLLFDDIPIEKNAGLITSLRYFKGNKDVIWLDNRTQKEYAPTATGFKNITMIKLSKLAFSKPTPVSLKL